MYDNIIIVICPRISCVLSDFSGDVVTHDRRLIVVVCVLAAFPRIYLDGYDTLLTVLRSFLESLTI
jgi:hypothetical protein